ncbi:MAG: cation:proton antiporter [Planctomycetota bacterium]
MIADVLALAVVGLGLLWATTSLAAGVASGGAELLLLPGLLLVMGVFAGRLAERFGLPRLTGYILLGVVVGPHGPLLLGQDWPGIVSKLQLEGLKPVKDLAIGLIALMAGCEIRTAWLRARLRGILLIAVFQSLLIPAMVVATTFLLPISLTYVDAAQAEGLPLMPILLLTGLLALISSPMVVVSVIKEARASGPLSETAMGAVVVVEVLVLLGFSLLMAVLVSLSSAGGSGGADAGELTGILAQVGMRETGFIVWSIALGLAIGYGLYRITERVRQRIGWILVGLALVIALLEDVLHVEALFCLLAAGFACENLFSGRSERGTHRLDQALEKVAQPVFVIFFMVAGLGLDLQVLVLAWVPVLWFVLVRAGSIWTAVHFGTRLAGAEPVVKRWCWTAMIPQAGVALALVIVIADQFPGWGSQLKDMFIAAVAVHELVGPVLLTVALRQSQETGKAD